MSNSTVCIICREGAADSKALLNNTTMILQLLECRKERVGLGQNELQRIVDHIDNLNETELDSVFYHNDCRKTICNRMKIDRLKAKNKPDDLDVHLLM